MSWRHDGDIHWLATPGGEFVLCLDKTDKGKMPWVVSYLFAKMGDYCGVRPLGKAKNLESAMQCASRFFK